MKRLSGLLALVVLPALAGAQDLRLIPKPRQITAGEVVALPKGVTFDPATNDDDRATARDLAEALAERGLNTRNAGGYRVALLRAESPAGKKVLEDHDVPFDDVMKAEGYVLIADRNDVAIVGASARGVFYGAQTLKQLIRTDGAPRITSAKVRDWPAMKYRGWQADFSRGPVHNTDFIKKQIRLLASYKLNVFSPYFEQTLAYNSNPLIAPPGGALSQAEVRDIVAYAKRYHVEVVPEQEAFGHLHHVLKYDIYSSLGETDHGHVLAPGDSASLPLIKQWFAEIDSLFPSKLVHIGADETFELGMGRTKDRVKTEGIGKVYLDFLKNIELALRPSGKRFLFWGDVAQNHPELVKQLPKDMIAVGWNYWSKSNFDGLLKPYADAGLETWVAPGVNVWNRVYPNNDIALANIQGFVATGQRFGSTGVLNTTWGDDGEALFGQTWYGFLFGAAASWQKGEASIPDFQSSYGLQFHGDPTGKIDEAQRKLAQAHVVLQKSGTGEGTNALYWLDPWTEEGQLKAQQIRPVSKQMRILAESAIVLIAQARQANKLRESDALDAMEMGARRLDFIGMKFQLADEIVRLYNRAYSGTSENVTHDLTEIASSINGRTEDLRDGYVLGGELYAKSWLAENRPYWLRNVANRYDLAAQLWIQRHDKVNQARAAFTRTKKLPAPEELGIPRQMPGYVP
jgi:hypothetical protein